ncbi:unnamed protein product [Boreogadus saida]
MVEVQRQDASRPGPHHSVEEVARSPHHRDSRHVWCQTVVVTLKCSAHGYVTRCSLLEALRKEVVSTLTREASVEVMKDGMTLSPRGNEADRGVVWRSLSSGLPITSQPLNSTVSLTPYSPLPALPPSPTSLIRTLHPSTSHHHHPPAPHPRLYSLSTLHCFPSIKHTHLPTRIHTTPKSNTCHLLIIPSSLFHIRHLLLTPLPLRLPLYGSILSASPPSSSTSAPPPNLQSPPTSPVVSSSTHLPVLHSPLNPTGPPTHASPLARRSCCQQQGGSSTVVIALCWCVACCCC